MSVPLIKLGYLLVRTLSKPIAKLVTNQAAEHPRFKNLCIKLSQSYHKMEVNLRSRISNSETPTDIRPLNDQKAVQLGANFIGEFVIFAIAGGALLGESMRSNASERQKKEALDTRISNLEKSFPKLEALESSLLNAIESIELLKKLN